jgi:geranylgeranyl pyrophosphate synthase
MRASRNIHKAQSARGSPFSPRDAWARAEGLLPDILALMHDQSDAQGVLGRAARYHLESGGKSFRARLLVACATQLGVPDETSIPAAAACELLHNASLVHDDVQDGDALRRGAPSVWKRFGLDVAIYLGDHFITQAFGLLAQSPNAAKACRLLELFASAVKSAIHGQLVESGFDARNFPTPEDYWLMAAGKSGALFALPGHAACVLAGEGAEVVTAVGRVLELYGVAYQIKDDLLDIICGKEGRPVGSDLAAGKANAVLILHLAASDPALGDVLAADLNSSMRPGRRRWWLTKLNRPEVLARVSHEHANLIALAEQAALSLPRPLRETLRYGLGHIVELPAALAYASEARPERLRKNRPAKVKI